MSTTQQSEQTRKQQQIRRVLQHEHCCCCNIQIGLTVLFVLLIFIQGSRVLNNVIGGTVLNQEPYDTLATGIMFYMQVAFNVIAFLSYIFGAMAVWNYKRSWLTATKVIFIVETIIYVILFGLPISICVISIIFIPFALLMTLPIIFNIWIIKTITRIEKGISIVKNAPVGSTITVV